jgi:hypothetical protein
LSNQGEETMPTTIVSPPGTYLPPGATAPIADPGGTYSGANATTYQTDPAGTYSSPYALNRVVIVWQNDTPDCSALAFTSAAQVGDYYGVSDPCYQLAKQFFSQPGLSGGRGDPLFHP